MKRATLICELYPRIGASGQEKYNNDIAVALRALGYRLDLIVTTPRYDLLPTAFDPAGREWNSVTLLHFRAVNVGPVPVSLASMLRLAKRIVTRVRPVRRGRSERSVDRVARIGRWLATGEQERVARIIAGLSPDIILTDTIFRDCATSLRDTRRLLIMHDIFHLRCQSFRNNGFTPIPDIDRSQEVEHWRAFDGLIAINAAEAEHAAALVGRRPVRTAFPTITRTDRCPHDAILSQPARPPGILFLGTNGTHNQDALTWFMQECWPAILANFPMCTLHVVGNVVIPQHASESVIAHGRLDNLELVARQCRVAINPVRMGSGLKIKMLDYLAYDLPVITTTIGAEGYPLTPLRPFVVADTPDAFIKATLTLLARDDDRHQLRERISDYLATFSPLATKQSLADLIAATSIGRCPT